MQISGEEIQIFLLPGKSKSTMYALRWAMWAESQEQHLFLTLKDDGLLLTDGFKKLGYIPAYEDSSELKEHLKHAGTIWFEPQVLMVYMLPTQTLEEDASFTVKITGIANAEAAFDFAETFKEN